MSDDTTNDDSGLNTEVPQREPPGLYAKGCRLMAQFDADDFHTNENDGTVTLVWTTTIDAESIPMEQKRIHFLTEVDDLGAAYECLRCGHATATKVEMKEHRDGLTLSECDWNRLKAWVSNLV